jgi:hypothetical protein
VISEIGGTILQPISCWQTRPIKSPGVAASNCSRAQFQSPAHTYGCKSPVNFSLSLSRTPRARRGAHKRGGVNNDAIAMVIACSIIACKAFRNPICRLCLISSSSHESARCVRVVANRVQRDRRVDIEIGPPAHNILKPIPLPVGAFKFSTNHPPTCLGLVHANDPFRRQICAEHSAKEWRESLIVLHVHLLAFDIATLRTNPCLVEARCLYKKGKRIEREVVREIVSELAQPTILRDVGELLTLLRALVFDAKHILKMMNHLVNENR